MRLFFATDIHGSETCWRKFLNSGKHYEADVIVLGGDMTGKALVPIVDDGDGRWHATLLENRHELAGEDEVAQFEERVKRRGYYPFRTDPDDLRKYEDDPEAADRFFHEQMLATVERWMALADEKLEGSGIRAFACPGNDDQFDIDPVIAEAQARRARGGPRRRDRGLPDGLDRMGQPDAVEDLQGGGRARSRRTYREDRRSGDGAAGEDDLQPALHLRTAPVSTTLRSSPRISG